MEYAATKINRAKLGYFFPFGSTHFENIEFIGSINPEVFLLCFDQEPINFDYNKNTFNKFNELNVFNRPRCVDNKQTTIFSKFLQHSVTVDYQLLSNAKKIPTILLNTEKDSEQKNRVLKEFNYIDCYYFFHALAASDWFRGYQYSSELTPISERKINKKFITFNRITGNSRIYRAMFVASLAKNKLIDLGHISFSKSCPVHGNLANSSVTLVKNYNLDKNYFLNELKYIETLPNLRIDSPVNSLIKNGSFSLGPIPTLVESFVQVVTETCFWDTKKHLTEKIFKPIVLKQPFILLGCAHNLEYLKTYGFKTFDRWWDESYDTCRDPIQRIAMVTNILETICKLSNKKLQEILIEMEEILEHNYQLFYSQKFIDSIWNELETNLNAAIFQASHPTALKTSDQNHLYIAENKLLV